MASTRRLALNSFLYVSVSLPLAHMAYDYYSHCRSLIWRTTSTLIAVRSYPLAPRSMKLRSLTLIWEVQGKWPGHWPCIWLDHLGMGGQEANGQAVWANGLAVLPNGLAVWLNGLAVWPNGLAVWPNGPAVGLAVWQLARLKLYLCIQPRNK